jgi:hypothetical protein
MKATFCALASIGDGEYSGGTPDPIYHSRTTMPVRDPESLAKHE